VAARGKLAPQGDRWERVNGVAEGGYEEAARAGPLQTSSASVWTIRLRSSVSNDIGVVMIVPTPASR
jgi:hypothetical protein